MTDSFQIRYRAAAENDEAGSPRLAHLVRPLDIRVMPIAGFPYLVFYMVTTDTVDIVRVLHSARDIPAHLRS